MPKDHLGSFGQLLQAGSALLPFTHNSSSKLRKWLFPMLGWTNGMGPWAAKDWQLEVGQVRAGLKLESLSNDSTGLGPKVEL